MAPPINNLFNFDVPVHKLFMLVSDNIASGMRRYYSKGILLSTSAIPIFKQD